MTEVDGLQLGPLADEQIAGVAASPELLTPDHPEEVVTDEQIYHAIGRMERIALRLHAVGARTRDGLFDQDANTVTATVGILRSLLVQRGSPFVEVLLDDERRGERQSKPGVKSLPVR